VVVDTHVAVNGIIPLSAVMEGKYWVPFALVSRYKKVKIKGRIGPNSEGE
jgi:hypothetical protein